MPSPRETLRAAFDAAIGEVTSPARIRALLPQTSPRGRTLVVAVGKAAAAMAAAVEDVLSEAEGIVVTRHGYGLPMRRFKLVEAGHPVPTREGRDAAEEILRRATALGTDDRLILLLSGGGSALMALPAPPVTLEMKQALTRALLRSGAAISEINLVRRHLSLVKGGKLLAAAHPARVVTIAVSDVPGDVPLDIASGPTVHDPSTAGDARAVLVKYGINIPSEVDLLLAARASVPLPDKAMFDAAPYLFAARPLDALNAAARYLARAGYVPVMLGDRVEGEAQDVARAHAAQARAARNAGARTALISGGELTVTLGNTPGFGGPNQEYALALALELSDTDGFAALAADTDGCDGSSGQDFDVAGAIVDAGTIRKCRDAGLDAAAALARHDAGPLLRAIDDALITGATRTNVNDLRIILIEP